MVINGTKLTKFYCLALFYDNVQAGETLPEL